MARRAEVERAVGVPAKDGTALRLDHYWPDPGGGGGVVWIRTPYGRRSMTTIARRFARRGAHVIVEAMRGTGGSGGTFDGISLNPTDGADVAAWLRGRPWFTGPIVTWGVSAIGYASWVLAAAEVPEWRLAVLQDAISEIRDTIVYPGGVPAGLGPLGFVCAVEWQRAHPESSPAREMLASVRGARRARKALRAVPLGEVDGRLVGHRVDYLRQWHAAERDDAYWEPLDLRRRNATGMPGEVHLASGWYDLCLASTLADYAALRDLGRRVRLVVGPWYHGRGHLDKAYNAEVDAAVEAALRGEPALGGAAPGESAAPVRVFVGGVGHWRDLADWPPPGYPDAEWHLWPGGRLATAPAPQSSPDRYTYNPADPTPSVGGAVENWDGSAGAKDNRRLEARADVLTYTSDVLTEAVEVIGVARAVVHVRPSHPDVDVVLRLCDVAPDGRSVNLCDGARRLRASHPAERSDGTQTVELDLVGVAHRFPAGHRIRLQVSSGAHPRLVRNLGTGEPVSTGTAMRPVGQEILHDPAHPSMVVLPTRA